MEYLVLVLWGLIFGITNTIPGVSGATVACICGFYDRLVNAVGGLFTSFKKNAMFLGLFLIGTIVGIFAFANLILWLYEHIPQILSMTFAGFILGSLPFLYNKAMDVSKPKLKPFNIILSVLAAGAMICLAFADSGGSALSADGFLEMLKLLGIGFACGIGQILPGISGLLLMMVMCGHSGYLFLLEAVKTFNLPVLIPFGIGVVLSVLMTASIIKRFLAKFPQTSYWLILGFVAGSVAAVMPKIDFSLQTLIAVVAGVISALLTYKLTTANQRRLQRQEKLETENQT